MTEYRMTGISKLRGAMFRDIDTGDKLIFEFDTKDTRLIHSCFVGYPLRVECFRDTRLSDLFILEPWSFRRTKSCDKIVETKV
jgi:hypothetical protein